jgi:hypothetical protein
MLNTTVINATLTSVRYSSSDSGVMGTDIRLIPARTTHAQYKRMDSGTRGSSCWSVYRMNRIPIKDAVST